VAGAVVAGHPQLGSRGSVVGHGGVVVCPAEPEALAGDVHLGPVPADRYGGGGVGAVAGAVVAFHPQLGTGVGVVGDRGVVGARAFPEAAAGDVDGTSVPADCYGSGGVGAVAGAVVAVRPHLCAGGVVDDRQVVGGWAS